MERNFSLYEEHYRKEKNNVRCPAFLSMNYWVNLHTEETVMWITANSLRKPRNSTLHGSFIQKPNSITVLLFTQNICKFLKTVRNIPKSKDRANWSRDTFQPMRRCACVYQQTNQNIAPVIKNFQNSGRSRTELKMSLQYSSRLNKFASS